jgi:4-aminobutyrate aminotransferase/diaminobutyrate-pyruvate transaminase/4-aminobutyrate aminotransferase/(S)-3-amino-2-methylpropionate transaminase
MAREFPITPRAVPRIETRLRRIATDIPVAESIPILEKLRKYEPRAMQGQPPVVWRRAEGFEIADAYGNRWIDWSSGVLITNAGHGCPEVAAAIVEEAQTGLLASYYFPTEIRARLLERLVELLPKPLDKVFLLTTGSETVECAIKLARMYGLKGGGRGKKTIVSFHDAFHGRTLGAQQAGGIPDLKSWIGNLDSDFIQAPFPDGYRTTDTSFESFQRRLHEQRVDAQNVAGVVIETYQGGSGAFASREFMQALRQWCTGHKVLLVCDEVQAGFGRTGTFWGFEHYGIVPDLALFGKGISSSLPLAAVAGNAAILDMPAPGSMSSTHSGNPVCCAAALASINVMVRDNLTERARVMGELLHSKLNAMRSRHPQIGAVMGKGLVAGVLCVKPGTKEPDGDLAWEIVRRCFEKGVLMFAPVGLAGATVKICPPLVITAEALEESVGVLEEAFHEATKKPARQAQAS